MDNDEKRIGELEIIDKEIISIQHRLKTENITEEMRDKL